MGTGERGLPLGKAKIQFHRNVKEGMLNTGLASGFLNPKSIGPSLSLRKPSSEFWFNGQKQKRIFGLDLFA